jgi:hypothetical protein
MPDSSPSAAALGPGVAEVMMFSKMSAPAVDNVVSIYARRIELQMVRNVINKPKSIFSQHESPEGAVLAQGNHRGPSSTLIHIACSIIFHINNLLCECGFNLLLIIRGYFFLLYCDIR